MIAFCGRPDLERSDRVEFNTSIEDGLIAEHSDQATRTPPPASMPIPAGFQEYR
jgi:hypothetical protein